MWSLLHVSVTSNHHQADISVHGHDMFSAYSMASHILYICCVEFQTFRLINCSIFSTLTDVFSEIIYQSINVGLSVKILNINTLNPELNPIYHLLALLGAHHILHISRVRVKNYTSHISFTYPPSADMWVVTPSLPAVQPDPPLLRHPPYYEYWRRLFSSQTFSRWLPKLFSNLVIHHLPAYEDGTECSETSAYKIQTPGNYPKGNIQHREHGGSLKSRTTPLSMYASWKTDAHI